VIEKTELDAIAKTTMAGLTVSHRPSPLMKAEVLAPVSVSSSILKGVKHLISRAPSDTLNRRILDVGVYDKYLR
jgi:hypothetical protein